jgi:CTP synthase (UTP-ammonia lyase)
MAAIALVGDFSPAVTAHRAIPLALELARAAVPAAGKLSWEWVGTAEISDAPRVLASYSAIWLVPASPYESMQGALAAVRFAREARRPFLGTCGGFQHALIEYARNVAGLASADHAETSPTADTLVVAPLACSLVEKSGDLTLTPGSHLAAAYARTTAHEGYHCNYGLNPAHRTTLERAGLYFTAFDENGDVRAAELPVSEHPFFVGTLFQPERAALRSEVPPLVRAFVRALG